MVICLTNYFMMKTKKEIYEKWDELLLKLNNQKLNKTNIREANKLLGSLDMIYWFLDLDPPA